MANDKKPHLRLISNDDATPAERILRNKMLKQNLRESIEIADAIELADDHAPCEGEDLEALETLYRRDGSMDPEMACALLEAAGYSIEVEPEVVDNVVDFVVEKADRLLVDNADVTPETVLKLALQDIQSGPYKNATKCYVTLVLDNGKTFSTCNYRANLTRIEEVAFRQLGLSEAVDGWRGMGPEG